MLKYVFSNLIDFSNRRQSLKAIDAMQNTFIKVFLEVYQIRKDLLPYELDLLHEILQDEISYHILAYKKRYNRLVKNILIMCGIIYNHSTELENTIDMSVKDSASTSDELSSY